MFEDSMVPRLLGDIWLTFKELIIAVLVVAVGLRWDVTLRKRHIRQCHIDRFRAIMKEIVDELELYWASDFSGCASMVAESKINAQFLHLYTYVLEVIELRKAQKDQIVFSLAELNTVATRGNFQTKARKSDPMRVQSIRVKANQVLTEVEKAIV